MLIIASLKECHHFRENRNVHNSLQFSQLLTALEASPTSLLNGYDQAKRLFKMRKSKIFIASASDMVTRKLRNCDEANLLKIPVLLIGERV
ncbi:hypothetical protein [Herbaspirillum sp. CF444]|uniref:hypothetical protein n=1 Tax=Herbaspirillum sp. CF444 TaxID=1144319 RepID=UPI0005572AD2|nr:hypothetical protein [Herbaspirillum sp. CF444]